MNEIDKIKPSEKVVMTDFLIRMFKSVGCSPTECHACAKEIKTGETFSLIPHRLMDKNSNYLEEFFDEMCCANCGLHELKLRDKRLLIDHKKHVAKKIATGGHGFSRPSKL